MWHSSLLEALPTFGILSLSLHVLHIVSRGLVWNEQRSLQQPRLLAKNPGSKVQKSFTGGYTPDLATLYVLNQAKGASVPEQKKVPQVAMGRVCSGGKGEQEYGQQAGCQEWGTHQYQPVLAQPGAYLPPAQHLPSAHPFLNRCHELNSAIPQHSTMHQQHHCPAC